MAARSAGWSGGLLTGCVGAGRAAWIVGVGNGLSGAGAGAVANVSGVGAMVTAAVGSTVAGPLIVLVGAGNIADTVGVPTSGAMRVNTIDIWVVSWARKLTPIKLKST